MTLGTNFSSKTVIMLLNGVDFLLSSKQSTESLRKLLENTGIDESFEKQMKRREITTSQAAYIYFEIQLRSKFGSCTFDWSELERDFKKIFDSPAPMKKGFAKMIHSWMEDLDEANFI